MRLLHDPEESETLGQHLLVTDLPRDARRLRGKPLGFREVGRGRGDEVGEGQVNEGAPSCPRSPEARASSTMRSASAMPSG